MTGLTRDKLIDKVDRFKAVEKIEIRKTDHMEGFTLRSGLKPASDKVSSQYWGLINMGIHLPTVVSKMWNSSPLEHPVTKEEYNPRDITDSLIHYCELNRTTPMYGYKDPYNSMLYGIVSPEHVMVRDRDVLDIAEAFTQNLDHRARYNHDNARMMLDYEFPELGIELPNGNSMNFCLIIKNSQFGLGGLTVDGGGFESRCGNGMVMWAKGFDFHFNAIHRWRNAQELLTQLGVGLNKIFSLAPKALSILAQANEITDPIIKENESVVQVLRSKRFNMLKREAESVYRRIISNPNYKRYNGFDIGRAIAEEARDTTNLDRRIELEQLAGQVMTSQVKH